MRTKLYEDMRKIDDASFTFASMHRITRPVGHSGSMKNGTWRGRILPVAANDNNPRKTTRMVAYNGGCSTTSGMVPVSVQRLSFLDGAQVAA